MSIEMYQQSILVTTKKFNDTNTSNCVFLSFKRYIEGQELRTSFKASMMFGKEETIGSDSSLCCGSPKWQIIQEVSTTLSTHFAAAFMHLLFCSSRYKQCHIYNTSFFVRKVKPCQICIFDRESFTNGPKSLKMVVGGV